MAWSYPTRRDRSSLRREACLMCGGRGKIEDRAEGRRYLIPCPACRGASRAFR